MAESEIPKSRFSRRSFIRTAGAGAAHAGASVEAQEKKAEVIGPDAAPITLSVNGVARKVTVEPRVTLLRALRNEPLWPPSIRPLRALRRSADKNPLPQLAPHK